MSNTKYSRSDLLNAGFSAEQIALLEKGGLIKSEANAKPQVPLVGLVRYTTTGSGKTSVYARISTTGGEWGASLVKLNEGNELNESGLKRLAEMSGQIQACINNPVVQDMKKKASS